MAEEIGKPQSFMNIIKPLAYRQGRSAPFMLSLWKTNIEAMNNGPRLLKS
ncbi:hypothetical protein EV690_2358 [Celerinatantimonas diazotrophica]|uniref:Uncharacterized protein n=1 Tax=Celerinatantimonas diazotrophica TaxID=412034 RepID=A0A4R1J9Z0_9GAMM|nr:hypothetical protein EV690_2358 [Celerinatantimonas diazotrophica]CAG9295044.1 hypothetical protein CEDIAZO_00150 [Celerinatantimonas diazotrophica]